MAEPRAPRGITIDLGPTRVTKLGAPGFRWSDAYHAILSATWPRFFGAAVCVYMLRLVVTLSGMDETFATSVSARHHYAHENILFDHRFVDMFTEQASARELHEDMRKFHRIERFGN